MERIRDRESETGGFIALVDRLRDEGRDLLRQEIQLAKTEISEKASRFGRNAIYVAMGGVVLFLGAVFFLLALSFLLSFGFATLGLSTGLSLFLGFVVFALLLLAIGGALAAKGISVFTQESMAPEKTLATLNHIKDGGLQHVPIPTAPEEDPADDRSSAELRSEVEASQRRFRRDWNGLRRRLNFAYLSKNMMLHVKNHPVRSVGISVGTGLAGFVVVRMARWFGRRRAA